MKTILKKNKKVTFVRIPKNASTSMYDFFSASNTIREHLIKISPHHQKIYSTSHCKLRTAVEEIGEDILSLPSLAVIRNPYDRALSMFSFAKKLNDSQFIDFEKVHGLKFKDDFLEFYEKFLEISKKEDFMHSWTQKSYIELNNKVGVKYLLTFENLAEDLQTFLTETGLQDFYNEHNRKLKKLNTTNHKHYRDVYCPRSREIVEEIWGEDIDYFQYKF